MNSRSLKYRLMEQYKVVKTIQSDTTAHKTIDLIQKKHLNNAAQPSHPKRFFMKREKKCREPLAEVIGLEILRYLLSHQPKASLLVDNAPSDVSDYRRLYIISREIDGFKQFYKFALSDLIDGICDGTYSGLGEELVATLFVGDDDFHTANVGIDNQNRVVRIDGGFFFESDKKLTSMDIDALPLLDESYPKNWLGIASWNEKKKKSDMRDTSRQAYEKISHQAGFRREVNRMLLRILVQPMPLLRKLIDAYDADDELNNRIYVYLYCRQSALQKAAVGNESFRQYLFSQASLEDLGEYFSSAVNFKTIGRKPFLQDQDIEYMTACHCDLLKSASVFLQDHQSNLIEHFYRYVCDSVSGYLIHTRSESMKTELVTLIEQRNAQLRAAARHAPDDQGNQPVAARTRSHAGSSQHSPRLFAVEQAKQVPAGESRLIHMLNSHP